MKKPVMGRTFWFSPPKRAFMLAPPGLTSVVTVQTTK